MIEKLLANPFAGDGTTHPDEHLIYVDEVCGLFKLAGVPVDVIRKKVFPLSLKEDALTWYRVCDDTGSWNYKRWKLEFHQKFLLGNVVISKKFLRTRKIMVMHSNKGRVLSTYPT